MTAVVVTHTSRADLATVDRFAPLGVSTTQGASDRAPNLVEPPCARPADGEAGRRRAG